MAFDPQPTNISLTGQGHTENWANGGRQCIAYYNDYIYICGIVGTTTALTRMHRVTKAMSTITLHGTDRWKSRCVCVANGKIYVVGFARDLAAAIYISEVDPSTFLVTHSGGPWTDISPGEVTDCVATPTHLIFNMDWRVGYYNISTHAKPSVYTSINSGKMAMAHDGTNLWFVGTSDGANTLKTDDAPAFSNLGTYSHTTGGPHKAGNVKDYVVAGGIGEVYIINKSTGALTTKSLVSTGNYRNAVLSAGGGMFAYLSATWYPNAFLEVDLATLTVNEVGANLQDTSGFCGRGTTVWSSNESGSMITEFTIPHQVDHLNDFDFDGVAEYNAYSDSYTPPWVGTPMRHPVLQDFNWQPPTINILNTPPA